MNLPNKITISRIGLAFIFMFFLSQEGLVSKYIAFIVFSLACFSDYLDGRIARRLNMVNDFGRLMDPIADKILILSAFLIFVEMKIVPAWMVTIVIFRELVITGLRILAATRGKVLAASLAGKHKTISQMLTIFAILIFLIIKELALGAWSNEREVIFKLSILYLMSITVILTLLSGISYLVKNKNTLFANEAPN